MALGILLSAAMLGFFFFFKFEIRLLLCNTHSTGLLVDNVCPVE